jgi:hypothetical protein
MALQNDKDNSAEFCEAEEEKGAELSPLKLDARGVPLVPQPSDHQDDPLVRTRASVN